MLAFTIPTQLPLLCFPLSTSIPPPLPSLSPSVSFVIHGKPSLRIHSETERFFFFDGCRNKRPERRALLPNPKAASQSASNFRENDINEDGKISKGTLIWRAVKLPIYSVAFIPLTVGSAAAYLQTGLFFIRRYVVLLSASILIITWLNLSNDVYDFDTGADKNKQESVVNIVGSRAVTLYAANMFLAIGFMGLVWASLEAGDVRSVALLTLAILCGYIYQCPPFRLSYQGLGEPLCFGAFGPFSTTAFYFSQSSKSKMYNLPLTGTLLSASVLVGITTTLILFCSHFHQIDGDKAVGKMSPLVRIGTDMGTKVVKAAIMMLYFLLFIFGGAKALPLTCLFLCALTLPIGKVVVDYVEQNHNDKTKIFMAKYYCVRLHALFGAALALGLVAARRMTQV